MRQEPQLVVGCSFDEIGWLTANYVAQWDGTMWGSMGGGTSGNVESVIAAQSGDEDLPDHSRLDRGRGVFVVTGFL